MTAFVTRPAWHACCTLCHLVTYAAAGLVASSLLDYAAWWETGALSHMRPLDSPWVAAGMGLQVVRGLIFAMVLYPFRAVFLRERLGWLVLWGLLAGVGILAPYGPSPGSVEGAIYTELPLAAHVFGLPEVYAQSFAFAACLCGWYRWPHRAWGAIFGILGVLAILASLAGVLLAP